MKTTYTLLIVTLLSLLPVSAQQNRLIPWDSVGQRFRIKKGESVIEDWTKISVENKYVGYSARPGGDYVLELKYIRPVIDTFLKINTVRSVSVFENATPVTDTMESSKANRTIQFDSIKQREKVLFGEIVNVRTKGEAVAFRTYFSFESDADGYWMELTDAESIRAINFDCMCKTFIVMSPRSTDINFDERLRYEQIIWTPRKDRTWEVRIGNITRGCKSEALDLLGSRRTKEYEINKPTCEQPKKSKR